MPRTNFASFFQIAAIAAFGMLPAARAGAAVLGVSGTSFTLTAKADRIQTPEGGNLLIWGFASGGGRAQYPAPTLIVREGQAISVRVSNQLPPGFNQRVSLAIAGQPGVTATCTTAPCVQGPITMEAGFGGTVTYTFTASRPGTFLYNSASSPDLQIEMGLTGAMIVQPATPGQAYDSATSAFDQEYLFFLTEMDSAIHDLVEDAGVDAAYASGRLARYFPNYWFINGRNAPDTMAEPFISRLPTQPYTALARTHPGDRLLMRVVGGGHDLHPFHHHGQHARVLAVDAHPLETTAGAFDLTHEVFTIQSVPGQTVDALFRWTGKDIGWDIYGTGAAHAHTCGATGIDAEGLDMVTREYCADHGKPLPVTLPEDLALVNGSFYSGSPYLGAMGLMKPGDGGLNPNAGYTYMWHSHTEKEITNFDIFPGGMMTMLVIEPPGTAIQ
jgi:FtsP/CotA-like multicopper oxidase with cupredoxin domain